MNIIFGKEWKCFQKLTPIMKLKVIWFAISFCLILCLSVENCGVLGVIALCVNLCASAIALRGVNGDGLDE